MGSEEKPKKGGPFVDDGFPVAKPGDADDERLVVGQMRALQRDVRDGFESVENSLKALVRIEEKLFVIIDRQNVLDRRQTELEDHQRVLDQKVTAVDARLTALEKRRAAAGRKR